MAGCSVRNSCAPTGLARWHVSESAIAWATAASAVAVIQLVRDGVLPQRGFLKQEEIPLEAFLSTMTGSLFVEACSP